MDTTYKQEVGVGAFVLLGFAVFVALLLWLTGRSVGGEGARIPVVFTNVAGLKNGDPVMVSGVRVGRVEGVHLERSGKVIVTLSVSSDVRPRVDAIRAVTEEANPDPARRAEFDRLHHLSVMLNGGVMLLNLGALLASAVALTPRG